MTHRRRTGVVVLALVGLLAYAAPFAVPGRAQELVVAGDTEARIVTVDIKSAGLAVPMGVSRASIAGPEGSATALFIDYALIATLLNAINPTNFVPIPLPVDFSYPSPLKASSTGVRDAERDARVPLAGTLPGFATGPVRVSTAHEEVHATPDPSGRAEVDLGGITAEGITRNAGGRSEASVTADAATATVTYQGIDIAGAVRLDGLLWQATQLRDGTSTAAFNVQRVVIGKQSMPASSDEQRATAFAAANQALLPLGIRLDNPIVGADADGARVGPLVIALTKSELRRSTIGEVYAAISPVLIQVFNGIQSQVPEAGYLLFAANIVLATLAGLGDFELQLGGVRASLGEQTQGDGTGAIDVEPAPGFDDGAGVALPGDLGDGLDLGPVPLPGPAPITGFDGGEPLPAAGAPGGTGGGVVLAPGGFAPAVASSDDGSGWWLALLAAMAVGGLALVIAGDPRDGDESADIEQGAVPA